MSAQTDCLESDWQLFRKRVPVWQENYMAKLIREYREILDADKMPSKKFWALEKRIQEDKRCAGVLVDMRRSVMRAELARMVRQNVIRLDDLEGFSQEVRDIVTLWSSI